MPKRASVSRMVWADRASWKRPALAGDTHRSAGIRRVRSFRNRTGGSSTCRSAPASRGWTGQIVRRGRDQRLPGILIAPPEFAAFVLFEIEQAVAQHAEARQRLADGRVQRA